jgi:hypothetical protein
MPQLLPAQHELNEQSPPTGVQPQKLASTQKPPGAFENFWQQLLRQSAAVVQEGRHPRKLGFMVAVTHVPLQQRELSAQLPPWGVHGDWHAVAGAHSKSPVLFRSVQQPLLQSVPVLHGR